MATTIVLVRHGQTDWNVERRFQGQADIPLNALGRAQATTLACTLIGEPFAVLYTSPLRRASETARIIGGALGLQPLESDALREVDVGSWSGLTVSEVQERYPDGFARWIDWRCEGWEDGEQYEDFSRRVVDGLLEMGSRHGGDGQVLAVTHGGPIRAAWASALRLPLGEVKGQIATLDNCATVRIAIRDGAIEAVH